MYAMRNHVESRHDVKVGDPLSAWIRAGERWDKELGIQPEFVSKDEGSKAGKSAPPSRASKVKGNVQSSVSTPAKASDTGKSLEAKMSELATAQSQLQANCAAAQSKTQSDCSVNSARILEIISNQEKFITSSTINSAALIDLKKEVVESL